MEGAGITKQQLTSIRSHTSACADPTGFVDDLQDLLQRQWRKETSGQICAAVIKDGKRHLMSYDGDTFSTTDISDVPDKDLVNVSSQDETFDQVQEKLSHFKNRFILGRINNIQFEEFDPDEYKFNFVHQGEQVSVPAKPGTIVICILAKIYPTYYDFNIYDDKNGGIIHYSNQKSKNVFEHSGDAVQENALLHFGKLRTDEEVGESGHRIAPFITGYHSTVLEKFNAQSPANLLFDHSKKIIHIIEFPLDNATVGEATLGIPGVGEFKNGYLYFDVFNKPETGRGSAPGYPQPETNDKLKLAVQRFSVCKEAASVTPLQPIFEKRREIAMEQTEQEEEQKVDPHTLQIEVGEVKGFSLGSSHLIKCVGGIACYLNGEPDKRVHTVAPSDLGSVLLPGLLGPIGGPFICLGGHPILGTGKSPHSLEYFKNCFPILTVSATMKDAARQTAGNRRINGLFIIEPEGPVDTIEKLAMVNKNAVTALAGPMSLILVKHGDIFLFLEGILLKGLVDKVPEFGDTVHIDMEHLLTWAMENTIAEPIVDITKCKPTIGDKSFNLEEIISLMKTLSIDEIIGMKQSILCLFYQLTRIYDDDELQRFAKELFDVLDKLLTAPDRNATELKKLKEDFEKGNINIKVSPSYRKTKEVYTKKRNQLRFLMDKVSSLLSEKNAASKALTHKQLKRFNAIKSNVDRLQTMSRSEFVATVEDSCSLLGVLVSSGDSAKLRDFLDTVGKNNMREKLISETMNRMKDAILQPSISRETNYHLLQLSNRQQMLDALTATCILEITAGSGPLRSVDNSVTLSIPETNDESRGAVLLPLMDMFVEMKDPYTGNWINLCNNQDVAMFRLLMRRTFIKASIGRELTQQIAADSKDLGWGMVHIYLDLMHQLSSYRTTPMSQDDFNDTLCQQIRCLFGLSLTQLAAGQDPISLIWQLWKENSRPDLPMQTWHWPLYLEMAHLMQFTGWSQAVFRRNLKILLIRTMNSKIAYPMCQFLRSGKEKIKGKKNNTNYEKKLQEIFYPAKKSLTKNMLSFLEKGEIPSKQFLINYENIFNQFTNKRVRKAGIKTILRELTLMIQFRDNYHEESKQFLQNLCISTLKKYEPCLKVCRLNLKRTLMKTLSENNSPEEERIETLTKEMEEVEMTFDKEKSVIFGVVFKNMKKVLNMLAEWSKDHKNELNISKEEMNEAKKLAAKMYEGLKFDCWNMEGIAHNEEIQELRYSDVDMDVDENIEEEEKDIVKRVLKYTVGEENKDIAIIVDTNQPAIDRVSILSKMMKIDEASVLIKLAGFAGFGETDQEITENLGFTLHQLFHHWAVDPPVLEKLIADKI